MTGAEMPPGGNRSPRWPAWLPPRSLSTARHSGPTSSAPSADDLVQETFVRLLTEVMADRPPLHLRGWLFKVATNLAASRARRQQLAVRRTPDLVDRQVVPSPEEMLLDRKAARSLGDRLTDLPAHVRTALLLSAHGFSGAEIAARIGRSELATRSLLCRHRRRLRLAASPAA